MDLCLFWISEMVMFRFVIKSNTIKCRRMVWYDSVSSIEEAKGIPQYPPKLAIARIPYFLKFDLFLIF